MTNNHIARLPFAALLIAALFGAGTAAASQPSAGPYSHPWNKPCPCTDVVHAGTAREAGMMRKSLEKIDGAISRALVTRVMPGAVVMIVRRGAIAKWKAYGYAAVYKNSSFAQMSNPVPMRRNTIFDLASISKLFTATSVMQLWDKGLLKLDDPVAKYLPEFGVNGKQNVTIRELLTHTSGFRPDPPEHLYTIHGTRADRLDFVLHMPLEYPPGTHYVYSDLNFITLGILVERLSGEREDVYVRKHITGPLRMTDTMYHPPANLKPRIAATEYQPWTDRSMVWGQVHDENSWSLGGVAGHAGVFSSAHDLAVFGQMMLNDGIYDGVRVLSEHAVKLMDTNWNKKFHDQDHGLGWELNQAWYMDALGQPHTLGHTGYTGTSIVVSPENDTIAILLTNRVHPTRNTVSTNGIRRKVARFTADAIPVITHGETWFSGYGNYLNRTLTAKVGANDHATLSFRTWYRMEHRLEKGGDHGYVEASPDGSHWTEVARVTGSSAGWKTMQYKLPRGTRYIQFRYQTDDETNGRGWYVDDVRIEAGGKTLTPRFGNTHWIRRGW